MPVTPSAVIVPSIEASLLTDLTVKEPPLIGT